MKQTLVFTWLLVMVPVLSAQPAGQQRPEPDLCAVPPGAPPQLPAKLLSGMGTTNMPVTTKSAEAQQFFNQGVSQVHSFWFQESERSFMQAAALDPDMAMAYWGIALSAAGDYRPAFQLMRDPFDGGRMASSLPDERGDTSDTIARTASGSAMSPAVRAREAAAKAMSLRDKVTERERLYIEAQAARRNTTAVNADADYIAIMRTLVGKYPDDLEARSMLGLALLDGYDSLTKRPRTNTLEGIRLLESIVARDDNHFGAHHYLIHGYEGSTSPEKAWHACERYAALVPNIPHALHMPGHIYAQSDKIDEAIAAFSAAAENELKYLSADALYPNGHHAHNIHFLIHSLNLDGRYQDSMKWARHLLEMKETPRERNGSNQRTTYRQGYFALVKTLVRYERWDLILDGQTLPVYDRPTQQAWRHWARGLALASRGELDAARQEVDGMERAFDAHEAPRAPEPLQIALLELKGTIDVRSGNRKAGFDRLRKAAAREAALIYTEPPSYPRLVVEGMANLALAVGDHAVAQEGFVEALKSEPGSGRVLFGLADAQAGLGKEAEARQTRQQASQAWNKADADLPQMQKLRTVTAAGR
jgi:tetratricopeptide (TPR) repeat protein